MSDWCQVSRARSHSQQSLAVQLSASPGAVRAPTLPCSFGGGWDAARGGGPPEPEDADAYARRLWEEKQRRQAAAAAAAGPSAAARDVWGAADAAARARDGR